MRKHFAITALALASALLLPVTARAAAHVDFSQSQTTVPAPEDAGIAKTVIAGAPVAGQHIRYMVKAKNSGDKPAGLHTPQLMIPTGQRYVANSATPGAQFSTDGGETWSRLQKPMSSHPINAIRWVASTTLAPGATETFIYDAVVQQ